MMTTEKAWSDKDLAELLESIEEVREQCGEPCGSTREFVEGLMWESGFAIQARVPHDALYHLGFAVGSLDAACQARGMRIEDVIDAGSATRTNEAPARARSAR